jgi:hypothetical protein
MPMTEAKWLACVDPGGMLRRAGGTTWQRLRRWWHGTPYPERKFWLVACACWRGCCEEDDREALDLLERFCEGTASRGEAMEALFRSRFSASLVTFPSDAMLYSTAVAVAVGAATCSAHLEPAEGAVLVREVFGNPFRPSPPFPPAVLAWNDGTVRRIAQGIYDERRMPEGTLDAARLTVLADALLDAGCEDEGLVEHCREPGPHVRGCWAVDFLLGRR